MSVEHERWVRESVVVEARYGAGGGIRAKGRVIAYTDRPTVVIETDDGARVDWIADLCRPVPTYELVCPECRDGKCLGRPENCSEGTLDADDEWVLCECRHGRAG